MLIESNIFLNRILLLKNYILIPFSFDLILNLPGAKEKQKLTTTSVYI